MPERPATRWGNGSPLDADWWQYAALVAVPAVAVGAVLVGAAKLVARTERGTMLVDLTAGVTAAGAIGNIVLVTMS